MDDAISIVQDPALVSQYLMQLNEGCDKLECLNFDCKGCPYFSIEPDNPNPQRAQQLALNHLREPKLCDGLLPTIKRPSLLDRILDFNGFLIPMVKSDDILLLSKQHINQFQIFLSDPELFPYILLENPIVYNFKDMQLNDKMLYQLFNLIGREGSKLSVYKSNYQYMLEMFLQQTNETRFHVRGLILLFAFHTFYNPKELIKQILPIINHIYALPSTTSKLFWNTIENLPQFSKQIVSIVQFQTQSYIKSYRSRERIQFTTIFPILKFLTDIYNFKMENPELYHIDFGNKIDYGDYPNLQTISEAKAIFPTQRKQDIFNSLIARERDNIVQNYMPGRQFPSNKIIVKRENIIQTALYQIEKIPPNKFILPFQVIFEGEEGKDCGGLTREFFFKLTDQVFSPDYGMFRYVNSKSYWFVPLSSAESSLFRLLGMVVALGAVNKVTLPVRFPILLYKKFLGKTIALEDLQEIDPNFVVSVDKMREMKEKGENIEDVGLYFTTSYELYGDIKETPLVPGGEQIPVTNDNFESYVAMYLDWHTNESIRTKYDALFEGFKAVFNESLMNIFCPQDLDQLVSGTSQYDWPALKHATRYVGYQAHSRVIRYFWDVFENDLTDDQRRAFLKFVTGADYSPIGGLGTVKLTIEKEKNIKLLPIAHTCMYSFVLPDYPTRDQVKKSLEIILQHTEGFGFI